MIVIALVTGAIPVYGPCSRDQFNNRHARPADHRLPAPAATIYRVSSPALRQIKIPFSNSATSHPHISNILTNAARLVHPTTSQLSPRPSFRILFPGSSSSHFCLRLVAVFMFLTSQFSDSAPYQQVDTESLCNIPGLVQKITVDLRIPAPQDDGARPRASRYQFTKADNAWPKLEEEFAEHAASPLGHWRFRPTTLPVIFRHRLLVRGIALTHQIEAAVSIPTLSPSRRCRSDWLPGRITARSRSRRADVTRAVRPHLSAPRPADRHHREANAAPVGRDGDVVFEDVSFRYGGERTLKDVSSPSPQAPRRR